MNKLLSKTRNIDIEMPAKWDKNSVESSIAFREEKWKLMKRQWIALRLKPAIRFANYDGGFNEENENEISQKSSSC